MRRHDLHFLSSSVVDLDAANQDQLHASRVLFPSVAAPVVCIELTVQPTEAALCVLFLFPKAAPKSKPILYLFQIINLLAVKPGEKKTCFFFTCFALIKNQDLTAVDPIW